MKIFINLLKKKYIHRSCKTDNINYIIWKYIGGVKTQFPKEKLKRRLAISHRKK